VKVPRAPPAIAPLQVLRPDWKTLTWLAYARSKPLDLNACPALTSLRRFYGTIGKPKPARFWGPNQETVAASFEPQIGKPSITLIFRLNQKTHHRFWGQTGRNRPNGFEAKTLINCRPWFWGSTKKPTLLVSTCTVQTAHGVTRPLDRPATARHVAPATYTPWDKQTWFSNWNKVKDKTNEIVPDSNSNLTKSMTHHNQTKELTT
jgi:hypothetical protein